jgi:hypothetical protein
MTVISTVFTGAIVALLTWFAAHWIGKPIVEAREMRIKALQAAEQNARVGVAAGDERITTARAALNDAASGLRSISRGHSWPVRLYCLFARIDLEMAASALITLHNRAGDYGYDNERRQFVLDAIYLFLGAHRHLSKERIAEIKEQVEREKRLSDVRF